MFSGRTISCFRPLCRLNFIWRGNCHATRGRGEIILIITGSKTSIKPPNLYGENKNVQTWKVEWIRRKIGENESKKQRREGRPKYVNMLFVSLQLVRCNMYFCNMNSIILRQWCVAVCHQLLSGFYRPPCTQKGIRRFENWICLRPKVVWWRGTKSAGMFSATGPFRTGTLQFSNHRASFPNATRSADHNRSNLIWHSPFESYRKRWIRIKFLLYFYVIWARIE